MTVAYDPHNEWAREAGECGVAVKQLGHPMLGPLVEGDLCTATVAGIGAARRYCQRPAVRGVVDVDGTEHTFCVKHVVFYFPAF